MAPRVLIAGYYGYGNLGDEAILGGMISDLQDEIPAARLCVLSADPEATRRLHGVAAIDRTGLQGVVEAIRKSNLLLVGGGGLFHDYWPVRGERLYADLHAGPEYYAGLIEMAALAGTPSMVYGVGLGPLESAEARQLTGEALLAADLVALRDRASLDLAAELTQGGTSSPDLRLASDPAFSLAPVPPEVAVDFLRAAGVPDDRPLLGAALRPWPFTDNQEVLVREVADGLSRASESLGAHVVLVPFHKLSEAVAVDDVVLTHQVRRLLTGRAGVTVLEAGLGPREVGGILGACQVVLAMRLHAAIFSLVQAVPFVALTYDPKLDHLLDEIHRPEWGLPLVGLTSKALAEGLVSVQSSALTPDPGEEISRRARRLAVWARELMDERPDGGNTAAPLTRQALLNRVVVAAQAESAGRQAALLSSQLSRLVEQRAELSRELGALRSTRGVKLLSLYWNALRKLLPEGSRRREAVYLARGYVGQLIRRTRRRSQPAPAGHTFLAEEPSRGGPGNGNPIGSAGRRATDPRVDLLAFEQGALEGGSGALFLLLTTTQLLEGEGQRTTQMALDLASRGIGTIHSGWRWHSDDLVIQDRLDQGILSFPVDLFLKYPEEVLSVAPELDRILLVAFPHPSFFPVMALANGLGWITAYDIMDDWEAFRACGQAPWYDKDFEQHLACSVDLVTAVNPSLAAKARAYGRQEVEILPNAGAARIERVIRSIPLERGDRTLGYFGHLAEAWLDWDLVDWAASERPDWKIYMIGYGGPDPRRPLPPNVSLLGRQPQAVLAALAANWDLAIVPFKKGPLADGVDAIKVYEYLAMGLPVVTTGVAPPAGAEEFVCRAESQDEFMTAIEQAAEAPGRLRQAAREYARRNTWSQRVDQLLLAIASQTQGVAVKQALWRGPR